MDLEYYFAGIIQDLSYVSYLYYRMWVLDNRCNNINILILVIII